MNDEGQTAELADPVETEIEAEPVETESEEPDETEGEEALPEDDGFDDVDYEGKQYRLPKELKEALLRQSDYTKKTMELADQRRAVETTRQQAEQAMQLFGQFQGDYLEYTNANAQIEELKRLDWNSLIEENPQAAMKLQNKLNLLINHRDEVQYRINSTQADLERRSREERERAIQEGAAALPKMIPGWNAEIHRQVAEYAFSRYGAMAKTIIDPKMVEDLYYAKLGREQAAKLKKPNTNSVPLKPTATVKSGTAKTTVNPDKLTTAEWLKWREGELKKANKR